MCERLKFDKYLQRRIGIEWLSNPLQSDRLAILREFLSSSSEYVLDCGCGEIEPVLVCNTGNAIALDIGISGLKNLKSNKFKGHLVLGSCTYLPFRDKCFEKSICSEVIEHLPTDLDVKKCIKELERVSNAFMLTTPNNQFDFRWLEHTHKRFFNTKNIRQLLPRGTLVTTSRVPHSKAQYMPILPYFLLDKPRGRIGNLLIFLDFHVRKTPIGRIVKRIKGPLYGMAFIVAVYRDRWITTTPT